MLTVEDECQMGNKVWNSTKNKERSRRRLAKRMTRSDVVVLVVLEVVAPGFLVSSTFVDMGFAELVAQQPDAISLAYLYR